MSRCIRLMVAVVVCGMTAHAEEGRPPNIVIILADDLGFGEPGCYEGDLPTPHIDSLARDGVRFTSGYVTAPFCAASRAALLTGRYQTRFGFEFNPIGARNADPAIGLPPEERTIADELRSAGYVTGLIGKWHLGGTARFHPQRRGFDEFFGFLHEGHYYVPPPWEGHVTWLRRKTLPDGTQGRWTSPDGRIVWSTHMGYFEPDYDADNPLLRISQPVDERENLTEAFTREAVDFIHRHRSQPFGLLLAYNAVHSPLQAADADLQKFAHIDDIQRRIFAAMLSRLDEGVGRVLAALHECELDEQTLVVFLSDNGGATRELTSSNRPLRGEKGQLLEGGIRVPFLMRWPGRLPAGHVEDRMVSSLDILATAVADREQRADGELDGVDLVPALRSPADQPIHEDLYWRVGAQAALRSGRWKIYRPGRGDTAWQLYDLAGDIGETRDLAATHPEQAQDLQRRWEELDRQMIAPLWTQ